MENGISIREFARRAGCDDKVVRRKVQTGHLLLLPDGKLDPEHLNSDWRSGVSAAVANADSFQDGADSENIQAEAAALVSADGKELWSKAEAERVKENYAARIKQLEYDRESDKVVDIDDVVAAVAGEYAIVRNKLLNIGSKVAPDISTMDSPEEIKALIDKQIIEALKGLTIDGDGERDFDKLRSSVQKRFGKSSGENEESQA